MREKLKLVCARLQQMFPYCEVYAAGSYFRDPENSGDIDLLVLLDPSPLRDGTPLCDVRINGFEIRAAIEGRILDIHVVTPKLFAKLSERKGFLRDVGERLA